MATGCWGVAWILAVVVTGIEVRRASPPEVWRAELIEEASTWTAEARPFFLYRISLAVLGQAGVIALDRLQPSPRAVGAHAAASATARLALVLATPTNRAYARQLSILLERRAFTTLLKVHRERLRWLVPALAVFLVVAFAFTRELLGLSRPEFARRRTACARRREGAPGRAGRAQARVVAEPGGTCAPISVEPVSPRRRRSGRARPPRAHRRGHRR